MPDDFQSSMNDLIRSMNAEIERRLKPYADQCSSIGEFMRRALRVQYPNGIEVFMFDGQAIFQVQWYSNGYRTGWIVSPDLDNGTSRASLSVI